MKINEHPVPDVISGKQCALAYSLSVMYA